jgi:predicted nucleic acid-binding protein
MILLDTSVLVYAVGEAHKQRTPCQRIVNAIVAGELDASTTPQVIQEFVHVYGRRRGRAEAAARAADWVDLLSPLVDADADGVREALAWFADTDLDATDAFLAAVTHLGDGTRLVSTDPDFAVLEDRWVTPAALAATLDR